MNSIEAAKLFGMDRTLQQRRVESLLEKEGAHAVGLAYYVHNPDGTISFVDPWGNVRVLKRENLTREGEKEEVADDTE